MCYQNMVDQIEMQEVRHGEQAHQQGHQVGGASSNDREEEQSGVDIGIYRTEEWVMKAQHPCIL